ncbi:MAG: hypothetical protein NY202_05170 [Mollicutes bacterium UO1]
MTRQNIRIRVKLLLQGISDPIKLVDEGGGKFSSLILKTDSFNINARNENNNRDLPQIKDASVVNSTIKITDATEIKITLTKKRVELLHD